MYTQKVRYSDLNLPFVYLNKLAWPDKDNSSSKTSY